MKFLGYMKRMNMIFMGLGSLRECGLFFRLSSSVGRPLLTSGRHRGRIDTHQTDTLIDLFAGLDVFTVIMLGNRWRCNI